MDTVQEEESTTPTQDQTIPSLEPLSRTTTTTSTTHHAILQPLSTPTLELPSPLDISNDSRSRSGSMRSRSGSTRSMGTGARVVGGRTPLLRRTSGLQGEPRGDATGPSFATAFGGREVGIRDPSPKSPTLRPRRSKRRRVKSFLRRWKEASYRHTWLNPLLVLIIVTTAYLVNPSPRNPLHAAIFLSYPLPKSPLDDKPLQYGKGSKDLAFVAFYTIFFSFTREFVMQRFLRPLAIRAGLRTRGKQARFMEQGYTAIYFGVFGPFGLYIMSRSPIWYFSTPAMYEGFPHTTHEAIFKAYYLLQASYWAQQAIVLLLLLEKPRKDFKELVAHHIITLSLIGLSYRFHFTYMGLAVYITHDISDFFLATSKLLNYVDSPIVIPYFCLFLGSWVYLRHYINLRIISSMLPLPSPFSDSTTSTIYEILTKATTPITTTISNSTPLLAKTLTDLSPYLSKLKIMTFAPEGASSQFSTLGPYGVNWATGQYKCNISQYLTFVLLAALQSVNLFWLFLIVRILWRIASTMGQDVQDDRSELDTEEEREGPSEVDLKENGLSEEKGVDSYAGNLGVQDKPEVRVNGVLVDDDKGDSVRRRMRVVASS